MMAKKAQGRRPKLTPEIQEKILTAIRAGNYSKVAAGYAGISEVTFYRWLRRGQDAKRGIYRDFYEAVRKAEDDAEVRAVAMIQKAMGENWKAALVYLERKHPDRWGRRDHLKVELDPRQALAELLAMSPEELDEAVEEAARQRS